jgi:hypothetical protein
MSHIFYFKAGINEHWRGDVPPNVESLEIKHLVIGETIPQFMFNDRLGRWTKTESGTVSYALQNLSSILGTTFADIHKQSAPTGMNHMDDAPRNGEYIILFGNSGYMTTPYRCQMCRYDAEYRPLQPWVTHSNDSFLDGGGEPIGWLPAPK